MAGDAPRSLASSFLSEDTHQTTPSMGDSAISVLKPTLSSKTSSSLAAEGPSSLSDHDDDDDDDDDDISDSPRTSEDPQSSLTPSDTPTVIHPKGNLLLIVGDETPRPTRTLLVSSSLLSQFSPRWTAAIAQSTRTIPLSRKRRLHLPHDDPDMMLVLMHISHAWHIGSVPRTLGFSQLLALTRIVERYDMHLQVSPWLRRWVAEHEGKVLRRGREQWLGIAWQFGFEGQFVGLARHLALNCKVDNERRLCRPGSGEVMEGYYPEEAISQIRYTRIRTLAHFFNIVYNTINAMENSNTCQAELPQSEHADINAALSAEHSMCTHANHGEMIRYLKMHGYWPPITQATMVTDSVNDVFHHLTSIPPIRFRSTYNTCLRDIEAAADAGTPPAEFLYATHAKCDMGRVLAARIADARARMENPVTQEQLGELRGNAVKSGLELDEFKRHPIGEAF